MTMHFGKVFKLRKLVEYEEGTVKKTPIMGNDQFKMMLLSFDKDAHLAEHKAPGDALILALKGKATLRYEGKNYHLEEGKSFFMKKGAVHDITAHGKFKMQLTIDLASTASQSEAQPTQNT